MRTWLKNLLAGLKATFGAGPRPRLGWNGRPLPEGAAGTGAPDPEPEGLAFRTLICGRKLPVDGPRPAPAPEPRGDEPIPRTV